MEGTTLEGTLTLAGSIAMRKLPPGAAHPLPGRDFGSNDWNAWLTVEHALSDAYPHAHLHPVVRQLRTQTFHNVWLGIRKRYLARQYGLPYFGGLLYVRKLTRRGEILDYGLVSARLVTTAFVEELINELDQGGATAFGNYHFHGFGSGTTAVANTDPDLDTEFTTQYSTDNTRPTGTDIQPTANQYRSVATFLADENATVEEHGIFNNATVGMGTLLDRHLTGTVALLATESIEMTYTLTITPET